MVKKKVLVFHSQYADIYRVLLENGLPEAELFVCRDPEEVEKWGPEVEIAFVPSSSGSKRVRSCNAIVQGIEFGKDSCVLWVGLP